jgi:ketosteroid isomerase-like protein
MLCVGIAGGCAALFSRSVLERLLLAKVRRDVRALNAGDYRPLLSSYAQAAVLRFPDGEHRWSGEHRGREAIERFLQEFVAVGLQGEVRELLVGGPPWRMTAVVRFDDHASGSDGEELYRNRAVLLLRARWGRILHQEDFFEDTERIRRLEERLIASGAR